MTIKKNAVCSSAILGREMHVNVYGKKGLPIVMFPTQGQAPESLEEVGVIDELADYLDSGTVQLFCAETIDNESWGSDAPAEERAQRQETYYHYVVDELVPLVHKVAGNKDARPLALGFDAGATQAAIVALRRPDLFQGCVCLSGCYDSRRYFGDWMDATLYDNTPCAFLPQMPADHPYVAVYNQRQLLFCTGQEASEADSLRSTREMDAQLARLGVDAWCDYWGGDVTHTWFWWKKQLRYFLPIVLADVEKTTAAEKPAKKRATTRKKATTAKAAATKTAATKAAEKDVKAEAKPAAKAAATKAAAAKAEEKPATKAAAEKSAAKKPAAKPAAKKTAAAKATAVAKAEKPAAPAKAEKPAVPAKAEKPAAPAKAVKAEVPAKAVKAEAPAKVEKPAAKAAAKTATTKAAPKAESAPKTATTKAAPKAESAAKTATTKAAPKAESAPKTATTKAAATKAEPAPKPAAKKPAAKPAPKATAAKKPAKGSATK